MHDLAGFGGGYFDCEAVRVAGDFFRVDVHADALFVGSVEVVPD